MQALATQQITQGPGERTRPLGQRLTLSWIRVEIVLLIGALIMAG